MWKCWRTGFLKHHRVHAEEIETLALGSYIGRGTCSQCGRHIEQQMPGDVAAFLLGWTEGELADRSFGYCEQDGEWVPALYRLTREAP